MNVDKIREFRLWIEVALAIGVLVFAVLYVQKLFEPRPVGVPIEAPPSPLVAKIPTERLDCVPVVGYKEAAKHKLNLPPPVQKDETKVVVDATNVSPDIRSHTISTVLDTDTGEVTTYDVRNNLPLFAINTSGHVGINYGTSDAGRFAGIEAQRALFNVKALAFVGKAEADFPLDGGPMRWKAMISGQYRF